MILVSCIRDSLKAAMVAQGITQRELCCRSGTAETQLSQFMNGRRDCRSETVSQWLSAAGVCLLVPARPAR